MRLACNKDGGRTIARRVEARSRSRKFGDTPPLDVYPSSGVGLETANGTQPTAFHSARCEWDVTKNENDECT